MDKCLREAIKVAGRDRYEELTRGDKSTSWTKFLTKSRDNGLLGTDTNQDGNSVIGLAKHVKSAAKDHPKFDPKTENAAVCGNLVRKFTSDELLDELILTWANSHGYLKDLPPTRPHDKYDDAEATKTFDDYDTYSTILPGDGAIPAGPPKPVDQVDAIRGAGNPAHVPRSAPVPNSAAGSLHHGHVSLNEQGLPVNITILGWNISLPVKWKVNGTLTSGDSLTITRPTGTVDSTPPEQDLLDAIGRPLDEVVPENRTPHRRSIVPANSTELEKFVNATMIRGETGPFNSSRLDDVADALAPPPTNTTNPRQHWCGNEDLPPPKPDPLFPPNRTHLDDPSTFPHGGRVAQKFQA